MKRVCFAALCLAFMLEACRNSTSPVASSSPTSSDISSSDQVVKAYSHFIPTSSPPTNLELVISPGFHINANPASFPYLIATEVKPGKADGIAISDKLTYPSPKMETFAFADTPLAVYEGSVTIPIPLTPAPGAKGQRTIPFEIRVQACDHEKCYPPSTLTASLPIDLDAIRR